jgi:hypothetical protein
MTLTIDLNKTDFKIKFSKTVIESKSMMIFKSLNQSKSPKSDYKWSMILNQPSMQISKLDDLHKCYLPRDPMVSLTWQ